MFNVIKSPAPAGAFRYTDTEVVNKVKEDFFDKCYLCEEKTPRHLEVEHFFPQTHFPHLVHNWNNLLCICEKCNKIRPKEINTSADNEVLDCCQDDVEAELTIRFVTDFTGQFVEISGSDNPKTQCTINLLERIYNGKQSKSSSYVQLRKLIAAELAKLEDDIRNMETYNLEKPFKEKIKNRLSRKAPFMAVKRTFIKENNPTFTVLFD